MVQDNSDITTNKIVDKSYLSVGDDKEGIFLLSQQEQLSPQGKERFDAIKNALMQKYISTMQSLYITNSPQYNAALLRLTQDDRQ